MLLLIQGETGGGKELLARAIRGDGKASGPCIAVNCGAATKALIADELPGHARGAFTGASNEGRSGRCGRCGHYHRISVTRTVVPPPRERGADVDRLVDVFNQNLARRHGLPPRQFSSDTLALLRGYSGLGNIRELRNIVESLWITAQQPGVLRAELLHEAGESVAVQMPMLSGTLLEQSERQVIVTTLLKFHGNLAQVAQSRGISRSSPYRKLETYRLRSLDKPADEGDSIL